MVETTVPLPPIFGLKVFESGNLSPDFGCTKSRLSETRGDHLDIRLSFHLLQFYQAGCLSTPRCGGIMAGPRQRHSACLQPADLSLLQPSWALPQAKVRACLQPAQKQPVHLRGIPYRPARGLLRVRVLGGWAAARAWLSVRRRERISCLGRSGGQPYAAKTAWSSVRWALSSQVGRWL